MDITTIASTAKSEESKYSPEQIKAMAQVMGIIMIGFTKQDVRKTLSFTDPDVWYTDTG